MTVTPIYSLLDILQLAARHPTNGLTVCAPGMIDGGEPLHLSYHDLLGKARKKARRLHLSPNRIILLHLDNQIDSIVWFWAVVYAGALPVLSTPLSSNSEQRRQHLQHLMNLLENPVVLTSQALLERFPELILPSTVTIEAAENQETTNGINGSTGFAKAIPLTINQILASVRGKSLACQTTTDSVLLNWIGLNHVANLLEIHLHAMYNAAHQIQVSAADLIADPLRFLRLIHTHRVTQTFSPNFFLALLSQQLADESAAPGVLDLSTLRRIVSGGEANVVETTKTLARQLQELGARDDVLTIAYGLTESCAANTYGVFKADYEAAEGHEFASVGITIEGARIRIQSEDSQIAAASEIGELQLAGTVIFKEYYRNPTATESSFTADGWFKTGDRAYIDAKGRLNLVGRRKEILIVNGVNYSPQDIETAVEKARVPGVRPTYFATFAYRAPGNDTEGYCLVYSPEDTQSEDRLEMAEAVARAAASVPGVRPDWVIPLPVEQLDKSSLGKLSRTKLQQGFLAGTFDASKIAAHRPIMASVEHVPPATPTEETVVTVLHEMLGIPAEEISVSQTVFELGVTSLTVFRFEKRLNARFNNKLTSNHSLLTFLNSPGIRQIAHAIDDAQGAEPSDPVVRLQNRGEKHPLWLIHPASGNILSFLPLARTITNRPLYALAMRGRVRSPDDDENDPTPMPPLYDTIADMAANYLAHVKRTQPEGPYAIAGYSLGSTIAFELAKLLEAAGEQVAFCAALDSPPHVKPLIGSFDWIAGAVRVVYFLLLIKQDDVPMYEAQLRELNLPSDRAVVDWLLAIGNPEQKAILNLDTDQVMAIIHATENFGKMARDYTPQGSIRKMDVFYCTPLQSVCVDRCHWVNEFLEQWGEFSRDKIEFIECDGDHADMLNVGYIEGFAQRLNAALERRGL